MTRSELVTHVTTYLGHQGIPVTKRMVDTVIVGTLEVIEQEMRECRRIDLRGFGSFLGRVRQARTAVNPRDPHGPRVMLAQRIEPRFRASRMLRDRLNPKE